MWMNVQRTVKVPYTYDGDMYVETSNIVCYHRVGTVFGLCVLKGKQMKAFVS